MKEVLYNAPEVHWYSCLRGSAAMEVLFNQLEKQLISFWNWFTRCFFHWLDRDSSRVMIWFQRVYLVLLYGLNISAWTLFLNFGNFIWGVQDWVWEWRYSRILKEAITSGQIPLHTDPPLQFGVSRVFGIPDVNLSPQMLLLRFLDPGLNFLINTLLMVSISYIGCLAIRRYFRLSLFSFTLLALLYNFNGFITAHIGIGHTFFTGYFFLPFFVLLILKLVEGKGSSIWFAQMGLVLLGIELLGSSRILVACFFFMGVLFLLGRGIRLQLLKAMIVRVVFNFYRIAPALISLTSVGAPRFTGFSILSTLVKSLIWIIPPWDSIIPDHRLGWWEFDMYISLLGLLLIAYFGLYKLYRSKMGNQPGNLHRPLMITLLIFAAFSIGYIYMPINSLPLPLFRLVHVPSRFFILPLLFLIALACICLQEWLDRDPAESWRYLVLFLLLGIFGHDLLRHTQLWRVEFVIESFSGGLYEVPLDFNLHIANQIDPLNTNTLIVSSVISLIAIVYIFNLLRKGFAKARSFG